MHNNELTPATVDRFLSQFGRLHDAVVHHVSMELFSRQQPYHITVTLGAKVGVNSWVNLILRFEQIAYFELQRSPDYNFSIVLGILINFFENHVCIDFDPYLTHHESFDDVKRPTEIKGPMFVIVSKHCYWHTEAYYDRDGVLV